MVTIAVVVVSAVSVPSDGSPLLAGASDSREVDVQGGSLLDSEEVNDPDGVLARPGSTPGLVRSAPVLPVSWPLVVSAVCVSADASPAKVPSVELVLRELNSGTVLFVEEFLEGVSSVWGLNDELVLCSEFAIS